MVFFLGQENQSLAAKYSGPESPDFPTRENGGRENSGISQVLSMPKGSEPGC